MKKMSFLEAVRQNIILPGQKVNPVGLFQNDEKEVILTSKETGWYESQTFEREEDLNWYFHEDYQGNPTLFGSTTKFNLYLEGINGYANGVYALHKSSQLYANPNLGIISRTMKEGDVEFLSEEILSNLGRRAWLGSSFVYTDTNSDWWGMCCVDGAFVHYYGLFYSCGRYYCNSNGVRPVVSILTPKVQVDLDSFEKDEQWKLLAE